MTKISVVCPVLNEAHYIDWLLSFLTRTQPLDKEIFLIDGGSTDGTLAKIREYQQLHKNIFLLQNPDRYVSYALNLAIPLSQGQYIVRLDGHCRYDDDYFQEIINVFETTGADIVGGPTRTAFNTSFQQAVGYSISNSFGVGNSSVHQFDFTGETDSVTFGSWKQEIFSHTGLFNTRLKRNQDDEFHYRAKSKGLRIFQSPSIKLFYYPRSSAASLFKQYFEYGLYKPLVLRSVSSEIKIRHLVPTLFAMYLILMPFLILLSPYFLSIIGLYIASLLYFSLMNDLPWKARIYCFAIFPTLHIAYGLGFLKGMFAPPK